MKEIDVIKLLAKRADHQQRYSIMVPNCYTQHDNEADLFAIRRSGFCDEFEVKLSRSDFMKDGKKHVVVRDPVRGEHGVLTEEGIPPYSMFKMEALENGKMEPNYFWYVVKEGICTVDEIPEFAGFIEITDRGMRILKSPTRLHSRKLLIDHQLKYAMKNNYRLWNILLKTDDIMDDML